MLHISPLCADWGIGLMDKLKIQWKVFAFLIGFCALLLVVFWLFQTVFLGDMYKLVRRNEIRVAIALVEQHINDSDLQDILVELEQTKEIFVTPSGEFRQQQRQARENRGKLKSETLTEERTFTLSNGRTLSMTFHAIITPVEATVSTLQMQLYIIIVIMILLSVALALIIARRVSKPIVEINKGAKKLAAGQYDVHFRGHGYLEVKELSDTLGTAAAELSKVEGLRRELMANISHDLRTPLALIYSYAEMMHDFPGEITTEQTQMIMDEAMRLTSLVNDVLDVSRLETGTIQLNPTKFNLTGSIKTTVARLSELIKKDGYTIVFEHNCDVSVTADEVKLTQALYNLLINAVTHGGADKEVLVKQTVTDGCVKIEIIDKGEGIAQNDLPNIWDRYYRVDKKHKRTITGSGLGLSIVKKIIELHGGQYGVLSEPGNGSIFWFSLKT